MFTGTTETIMMHEMKIDEVLTVHQIHHQPDIWREKLACEIRARYPDAELIEVPANNQIPELFNFVVR